MRRRAEGVLRWLATPTGLVVLALLVRLAFILSKGNRYYFGDTAEYEKAALRLLHGQGLDPKSPRAPAYPLVMALGFLIGGEHNYQIVRVIMLTFSVALMLVVMRQARAFGGRAVAALAGLGVAFAPTIVFVAGMLYPTQLLTLSIAGLTLAAWSVAERPSWGRGAAWGLWVVLGWLTDPVIIAPALGTLAWLAAQLPRRRAALARALVVGLVTVAALLGPYMHWQRSAPGEAPVFMAKAQYALWSARTDSVLAQHRMLRFPPHQPFQALPAASFLTRELRLLREHPVAFTHDITWEFFHFFAPLPDRIQSRNRYNQPIVLAIGAAYFVIVLVLAPIGLLWGAAPGRGRALLAAVVVAVGGFYACFFTQTRYRIPVEPQLLVLAALGACRLFPRLTAFLAGQDAGVEEGGARAAGPAGARPPA